MHPNKNLHFIGVGGSGMSALAQLATQDQAISGSDRFWPEQSNLDIFVKLQKKGVRLYPQNGDGITPETSRVVYSTAIEEDNPDLVKAKSLRKNCLHRTDFLSELVSDKNLIAIGGTSGKSTICGMAGVLFEEMGLSPSIMCGGEIKNFTTESSLGNAKKGLGEHFLMESDESDGSLNRFSPDISVLSNISKDHKTLKELRTLFTQFANQTKKVLIVNQDCPQLTKLKLPRKILIRYGIKQPAEIQAKNCELSLEGSKFTVQNVRFVLRVPGWHNISNALASLATGLAAGLSLDKMPQALESFQGIKRRLELIAVRKKFRLFDDFAHNPDKIRASLRTLSPFCERLIVVFQPHGYTPTQFLFEDYVQTFAEELKPKDQLYLLPIFDAGGTAKRNVTSHDLATSLKQKKRSAKAPDSRNELLTQLKKELQPTDTVLVMGARDPSLTELCEQIKKL